jgi:acyl-[acyl-carrier-protein]-phospholipid O-acyltransferase / long-chain-fatty-acid--[acyl-carrier-protein] ligase
MQSEKIIVNLTSNEKSWKRSFWSLIVTQFQGAFSDNALKNLVIYLIVSSGLPADQRDLLIPLAGALFALPFILFSMAGGYLADRLSKRSVTIGVKYFEIVVMLIASIGLAAKILPLQFTAIFLMGVHSAIFGPSKYGLLPELLPEKRLSWGNGVLELGTFLAIITGTVTGAMLSENFKEAQQWSGIFLILLAIFGLSTSYGINRVPAAAPAKIFRVNFFADLLTQIRLIRRDRVLYLSVVGNTYFWFLGALAQFNIVLYGSDILHISGTQSGYLQAAIAIGIGVGSLAAGYLSGNKIEYGLIPLGSIGLTVFASLLYRSDLSFAAVAVNLGLLGFFSGFFVVPINALIQHRPNKESKGGVLAAANLLSFIGVFLASGVWYGMKAIVHFDPPTIFLASAILTLIATIYVLTILPDMLLRFLLWLFTHSVYRIKVTGRDNIPDKGGALFVCNHLSFVDGLLLIASTDRFVRFIMYKGIYDMPLVKPFVKIMGAIPISSQLRPREMLRSLQEASDAIKRGEVVCIFAEGQITRIGQLLPFRRGLTRIMKDVHAPIIPVCLDGVWGSIFSYEKGRFLWKIPHRLAQPVTVSYGKQMSSTSSPFEVRQSVQELNTDVWHFRKKGMKLIHRSFVHTARRFPFRFAMADLRTKKLRFGLALTRTIFLARRLRKEWVGQEMVGILLPPSIAGALVNFAALLMGKVPVNLNYTASNDTIASCAQQCTLKTVITSKAFLERVTVAVPGKTILLEDLAQNPRRSEKISALLMTYFMPVRLLERSLGRTNKVTLDDLATIIFSSGSTGDPKGVMLTHYNIASNIQQMGQIFAFNRKDRILGILPFFHSFGFTATIMVPTALGVGVVYHPNPFDAQVIGEKVREYSVTFLLATPTMLQAYMRRCQPEDFGSLQFVMAGAEKLPERIAQTFDDVFGIRPMEGYGCTECAPVVSVNTHDYRAAGFRQVGAKRGKIGHPLPGLSVKIVDPETRKELSVGEAGMLLVKGPNVMKGYLGRPEQTEKVLADGWYITGDIAALDEDGFLQITDRLSRFSKIAGEMVPHIKVEEKLHELADVAEQTFAVTGVPDESKGEHLIALHTLPEDKLQQCLDKLKNADMPNLWKPKQFFRVDALPYLGTGKLDLRKVREVALGFSNSKLN